MADVGADAGRGRHAARAAQAHRRRRVPATRAGLGLEELQRLLGLAPLDHRQARAGAQGEEGVEGVGEALGEGRLAKRPRVEGAVIAQVRCGVRARETSPVSFT